MIVTEIYPAIFGEADWAGWPGLIVRLTGCNLRCAWCDSTFAFAGGKTMTVDAVVAAVIKAGRKRVLLTGGEPLTQPEAPALMRALIKAGHAVMVETNGSVDVAPVPKPVHVVMDLKAPGSGSVKMNRLENLDRLKPTDEIKIVISSRADYVWARKMCREHRLGERFTVSLSPAGILWEGPSGPDLFRSRGRKAPPTSQSSIVGLDPADLAGWILKDRLNARLGLQIHKVIFGEQRRT